MKRSLRRVAIGVTATAAVAAGFAQPAMAGPAEDRQAPTSAPANPAADVDPDAVGHGFFNADGVNIRTGPGTGYPSIGAGHKGQDITVYCTGTWWRITNEATGVDGWVYWPGEPESYVLLDHGSVVPPDC